MNRWRRVGLALLFITTALGLCVAGEATYDDRWPYPTAESVVTDYDRHVGERVLVFGTVEAVTENEVTMVVEDGGASIVLSVRDVEGAVVPGGTLQVTGTLQPDHHLAADTVVVVNESLGAKLWKYAASLAGLLVFLGLFVRHWRVKLQALALEVREDG